LATMPRFRLADLPTFISEIGLCPVIRAPRSAASKRC